MKQWLNLIFSSALTVALINGLGTRFGRVPPLGPLLSPFAGVWTNAEKGWGLQRKKTVLELPELTGSVSIQFDASRVPHIFAENNADLYFAQGWTMARDRLWQMDFTARVGLGRLSEVVGARALPMDRMFVRLKLQDAALKSLEVMNQDRLSQEALDNFSRGVNAYIQSLPASELPLEFKLLDYKPELWTPLKSAVIVKLLAFRLSGMSSDLKLSRTALRMTPAQIEDLFPLFPFGHTPTIGEKEVPAASAAKPKRPEKIYLPTAQELSLQIPEHLPTPESGNGSNNWGVMGSKTRSGFPMISNDLHLGYSVPSMWYQVQLSGPDANTYGVSIAGVPGIVVGFNQHLAWATTNGYADVMDWYAIQFRDSSFNEYWHDNQWMRTQKTTHLIKVRDQKAVEEVVVSTHHGPVMYNPGSEPAGEDYGAGLAVRWVAHDPSNEVGAFLELNRAQSVDQCLKAMERLSSPQENILCADDSKQMAFVEAGKIPLKWKGQGRFVGDGRDPVYEWQGWLTPKDWPQLRNPTQGFVFSANQNPVPENYPFYLGWDYPPPWRAHRISQMLSQMSNITIDDMERMQMDSLDLQAQLVLPALIKAVKVSELDTFAQETLATLSRWDFQLDADSIAASVFYEWWNTLREQLWSKRIGDEHTYALPRAPRMVELITKTPTSVWFDDPATAKKETLVDWATSSFAEALKRLQAHYGSKVQDWRWSQYRPTVLTHLGHFPGLQSGPWPAKGGANAINANQGEHGPVWRMVIELGPEVHGKGIYPGGQSGNPGSRHYEDFTHDWLQGKLREFVYLKARVHNDERIVDRIDMVKQ